MAGVPDQLQPRSMVMIGSDSSTVHSQFWVTPVLSDGAKPSGQDRVQPESSPLLAEHGGVV